MRQRVGNIIKDVDFCFPWFVLEMEFSEQCCRKCFTDGVVILTRDTGCHEQSSLCTQAIKAVPELDCVIMRYSRLE